MKIDIDGKQYEYIADDLTLQEAFELKAHTGWGIAAFYEALSESDPGALAWIAYVARQRAGDVDVKFSSSVVKLGPLVESLNSREVDEADPTPPETD